MNLPFDKRLAQRGGPQTFECLGEETISSFFESVSTLSGRAYPEWVLSRIKETYYIPNDPGFLGVLLTAQELCGQDENWDRRAAKGGPPDLGRGFELMYQLLIEPFYLINLHHR